MNWMMKNSEGKKDAMFTTAILSFVVAILCIMVPMLNGFTIPWTDYVVSLERPDTALILGFLGVCYTGYVVRRNAKLGKGE